MSSHALKPAETASVETQAPSGWDPFQVWRERVHKPRAHRSSQRSRVEEELPFAVLKPKQGIGS
jgi:hypothetical protein